MESEASCSTCFYLILFTLLKTPENSFQLRDGEHNLGRFGILVCNGFILIIYNILLYNTLILMLTQLEINVHHFPCTMVKIYNLA